MSVLIAAIVFIGLAVFIMCFNVIFRKKPFPDGEIEHNIELRKRGILCAREEEMKLWGPGKGRGICDGSSCGSCGFGSGCGTKGKENSK